MKAHLLFLLAIPLFLACSGTADRDMFTYDGFTQGTTFSVKCYPGGQAEKISRGIDSVFFLINQSASLYDSSSLISLFNRNKPVQMNDMMITLIRRSIEISEATGGAFDITVGPLVRAWGFYRKQGVMLPRETVDSLMPHVGYRKITIEEGQVRKSDPLTQIDLNAIAQGYTVDLVAGFLEQHGITDYLIDVGGEVRACGLKAGRDPWVVGIEEPARNDTSARSVLIRFSLKDQALATSGNYRNYFYDKGIKYSHTLDPRTGTPVSHRLLGVTVMAPDGMTADSWATALMVMGPDSALSFLEKHPELKACLILSEPNEKFTVRFSGGFEQFILD